MGLSTSTGLLAQSSLGAVTFVSAVAVIAGTPLSRMMANFFMGVSKPIVPTRLFEDEQTAVAWLGDFVE